MPTEHTDEYDRLKAQKDAILEKEREALLAPLRAQLTQAEQARDAALAEVERLRLELAEANASTCEAVAVANNRDIQIARLENRVADARAELAGRWRPIAEMPSESDEPFILLANGVVQHVLASRDSRGVWISGETLDEMEDFQPTHWQPLPQPPEGAA